MGDTLHWTPINRRAKYDAVRFILKGEIHNRTKLQKTQTLTDISTPCPSTCVDKNTFVVDQSFACRQ